MDPTSLIERRDLSLTYAEFSSRLQASNYIGLRVLPPLAVPQENSNFQRLNVEHVEHGVEDTRRNVDGTYRRDEGRFTTDSYNTVEHGVEERVDYGKVERWGDIVRVEDIARERAIWRMLRRMEYDISQAVFRSAVWSGKTTASENGAWTTTGSGTPIVDIDAASDSVKSQCGYRPTAAVMSFKAYRAMLRTDEVEGLLKYDGVQILLNAMSGNSGDLSAVRQVTAGLLDLLQLQEILVGDASYNATAKGGTASFTDFWDTTLCLVCRIEDDGFTGDLEMPRPHIGRTLFCTKDNYPLPGDSMAGEDSLVFDEYEDPRSRGKYIRPRNKRGIKLVHKECGHLITTVTA